MSDEAKKMQEQAQDHDVEGHRFRNGAERVAFGTEDAAEAERRPNSIRPDDGPEPEVEGHRLSMGPERFSMGPERLKTSAEDESR